MPASEKPASEADVDETTAGDPAAADEPAEIAGADEPAEIADLPGRARPWLLPACLGVAVVILGGFGFWARTETNSQPSQSVQNTALTDRATTSQVRSQITAAVNTIFSYSYADTAATSGAAQRLLTGPAIREYNQLFALVRKEAPASKLILSTRVTNAGVELLTGDRARVLVFANQQDTIAGTRKTSYAGAMFAVTAVRAGGRWKIEGIDTFAGS